MGLEPGTAIGGYTIVSQLGSGAMGVVYKAVDDGGHAVAFKVLRSDVIDKEELRKRLVREAAALQKVKHQAVAAMLDAETESDETFIVTELIEGPTLDSYVADNGPLNPDELLHTAQRLAGALSAVHRADVVHRDMKPNNVLMGHDGAVLIDFGIAHGMEDPRLTATGMVIGTPGYLAPELVTGASPSADTDWWGWAAVLVFAATGRPPFGTGGYELVIARAMTGKADVDGLDRRIAVALRGALAVRAEHRWSAQEVIAELEDAAKFPGAEEQFLDASTDVDPTQVLSALEIAAHEADLDREDGAVFAPTPRRLPDEDATRVTPVATSVMPVQMAAPQSFAPSPNGAYSHPNQQNTGNLNGYQQYATPQYQGQQPPQAWPQQAGGQQPNAHMPQQYAAQPEGQPGWLGRAEQGPGEPQLSDQQLAPEFYQRPKLRPRPLIFGTAALAVMALGARQPYDTLIITLLALLVFSVTGAIWDAFHTRREYKGQTKHEVMMAVLWFPWRVIRGALGIALTLLLGLAAAVPVGAGMLWGFQTMGNDASGTASTGQYMLTLAVMWVILLSLMWFGPLPRNTREGGRYFMQVVVPGKIATAVLVGILALAFGFGAVTILDGSTIEWSPLQEAPRIP